MTDGCSLEFAEQIFLFRTARTDLSAALRGRPTKNDGTQRSCQHWYEPITGVLSDVAPAQSVAAQVGDRP